VINKTPETVKEGAPVSIKSEKYIKEKKIISKDEAIDNASVNPDLLSDSEKLAMLDKLTDKEREVLLLAAEGKKNGEIASILNSSESSVKVHRSRMTSKLGMKKPEDLKKMLSKAPAETISQEVEIDEVTEVTKGNEVSYNSESDNQNPDLFTKP
jgi:DNA-binding NarL/FixJ family response regulator